MKNLYRPGIIAFTVLALFRGLALDSIPDQAGGVRAIELVDGDDSGRRGDVDFGEPPPADHVNADEQQSTALEFRPQRPADIAFRIGQLGRLGCAAGREVGANIPLLRPAVDGAGELAVN